MTVAVVPLRDNTSIASWSMNNSEPGKVAVGAATLVTLVRITVVWFWVMAPFSVVVLTVV